MTWLKRYWFEILLVLALLLFVASVARAEIIVAASDSQHTALADYTATGSSDQVLIQSLLSSSLTVRLLEGTFVFDNYLGIKGFLDGGALVGAGPGQTVLTSSDPDVQALIRFDVSVNGVTPLERFTISGMTLDGDSLNASPSSFKGLIMWGMDGTIRDLVIENVELLSLADRRNGILIRHNDGRLENARFSRIKARIGGEFSNGIKVSMPGSNWWVVDSDIRLTATGEAHNGIALYGAGEGVHVRGNYVEGLAAHSLIALSPARRAMIHENDVRGSGFFEECGIEYEFKAGHGNTANLFPTDAVISGNIVSDAYWGICVTQRQQPNPEPDTEPRFVIVTDNIVSDSGVCVHVENAFDVEVRDNLTRDCT